MKGSPRLIAVLFGLAAALAVLWLLRETPDTPESLAPVELRTGETAPERVSLAEVEVAHTRGSPIEVEPPAGDIALAPAIEATTGEYEISGRVLDASGAPVGEGARVAVCSRREWVDAVSIDAGSPYTLHVAEPGEYVLRCEASGYALLATRLVLSGEPRRIERDLQLKRKRRLLVRVSAGSGQGLEGFLARSGVGDPDELQAIATTTPLQEGMLMRAPGRGRDYGVGRFHGGLSYLRSVIGDRTVEPDMLGVLELHADPPLHVSIVFERCVLATRVLDAPHEEIRFQINPEQFRARLGRVSVRVVEAGTTAAVRGTASVSVFPFPFLGSPLDVNGRITFRDVAPGDAFLVVEADGLATLVRPLVVPPGESLDLGTVTMTPGTEITGTVVDELGAPVVAHIVCLPLATPRAARHLMSESDGSFRVADIGPERYALFVAEHGPARGEQGPTRATRAAIIDASEGRPADVRLELHPAVQVTFEHLSFDPAVLELAVHDASGVAVRSGNVERWNPFQTVLVTGDYSWIAYRGTGEQTRGSFEVGALDVRVEIEHP